MEEFVIVLWLSTATLQLERHEFSFSNSIACMKVQNAFSYKGKKTKWKDFKRIYIKGGGINSYYESCKPKVPATLVAKR